MNNELGLLLQAIRQSKAAVVMKSRKHCHARNVSSIVVEQDRGERLLRAFLAWPGHKLHTNHLYGDLAVGIHDHRYDLALKRIIGDITHTTYKATEDDTFAEWSFQSKLAGDESEPELVGRAGLHLQTTCWLNDRWLEIDSEVLHTVACLGPAAWWVREGTARRSKTRLFTKSSQVVTDGLYESFDSPREVYEHVLSWAQSSDLL